MKKILDNPALKAKSDELCRRGIVRHLLTKPQKDFYDLYKSGKFSTTAIYASRKVGKSVSAYLIACEFCWANPGAIVRIVLPQLKQAKEIYEPIHREFKPLLPKELNPDWKKTEGKFLFHNDAVIILGGSSPENIESSRGPITHLLILDEIAAFDEVNYEYALFSILYPQLTTTKGKTLHLTTPSRSPSHPWIVDTLPLLESKRAVKKVTIDENPLIDEDAMAEILDKYGSRDNPNFRREYLLELIPDDDFKIVPEYDALKHNVLEPPKGKDNFGYRTPYIGYIACDYGEVDLTAILAAIYDHNTETLYVVDEWIDKGSPEAVASQWHRMTHDPLRNCPEIIGCMDVHPHVSKNVFQKQYNLTFNNMHGTKLTDLVPFLRNCFERGKIKIVKDRCPGLISQLSTGIWNDKKTSFERTSKGHWDAIAALCYLAKSIKWNKRPGQSSNTNFKIGI